MRKNFIWNSVGITFNSLLSFIFVFIVTRFNGIEAEGIFTYVFSLALILYTISCYGGRIFQVSDWKNEYKINSYFYVRIISSAVALILILVFSIISNIGNDYFIILLILMAAKIIESFSDVLFGILQKNDKLYIVGISMLIKALLSIIGFLIVDIVTHNLIYSSLCYLISNFVFYIIIDKKYSNFNLFDSSINKSEIRKIFLSNLYIFLCSFLIILILNIPRYVAFDLLNSVEKGYLGIFLMIPTIISLHGQFVIQPIVMPITNYFKSKKWIEYYNQLFKLIIFIIVIGIIGVIISLTIGPALLELIFGISFLTYKLELVYIIIGGMFNGLTTIFSTYLTIMRKTKIQFLLYLIIIILEIILCYYITKFIGFRGIFISFDIIMILQFILFVLIFIIYGKKEKNEKNITHIS